MGGISEFDHNGWNDAVAAIRRCPTCGYKMVGSTWKTLMDLPYSPEGPLCDRCGDSHLTTFEKIPSVRTPRPHLQRSCDPPELGSLADVQARAKRYQDRWRRNQLEGLDKESSIFEVLPRSPLAAMRDAFHKHPNIGFFFIGWIAFSFMIFMVTAFQATPPALPDTTYWVEPASPAEPEPPVSGWGEPTGW